MPARRHLVRSRRHRCGRPGRERAAVAPKIGQECARVRGARKTLAEAPAERARWSATVHQHRSREPTRVLPVPGRTRGAEMPATKRSYRQRGSTSLALGLVVEILIPFELTH